MNNNIHTTFDKIKDGKHIYKPIFRILRKAHVVKVPTEPNTKNY